jgi:hypothetical protein
MADMASKCAPPPSPRKQAKKLVSLPMKQPTAEEVAMDVARIMRQIEQIRGNRPRW